MLPRVEVFGMEIVMYDLMFYLGLITVPIFAFALRKKFEFTVKKTIFYSVFTLAFGYLSAMITAWIEGGLLSLASGGEYDNFEKIRNYGIPMFLPIFYLIFCLLFRAPFRKLSDYIAPCVYSVMTFVKIGCTLGGCCYGEADPNGIWSQAGFKTFPVQIYDALSSFVITIICVILIYTLRKKHEGYIYPIGGMLFAATKGFWENYRVHTSVWERNFFDTGWTLWQYWMTVLFIGCFIWLVLTVVQEKKQIADFDGRSDLKNIDDIVNGLSSLKTKIKRRGKKKEIQHHKKK